MKPTDTILPPVVDIPRGFKDPAPIRSVESEHKWLWGVYVAVAVIAFVASTVWPMGWAS